MYEVKTTIAIATSLAEKLKELKEKYRFRNMSEVMLLLLKAFEKVSDEEKKKIAEDIILRKIKP